MCKIIYLASPYTNKNCFLQSKRAMQVAHVAAKLMEQGHVCYSHVVLGHEMAKYSSKLACLPSEAWQDFCNHLFGACNELFVLCLDGWKKSIGVQKEIEWAKEMNMPIYYIDKDLNVLDFMGNISLEEGEEN